MRTSAIIVGGGIGGLATAVALSRDGWNVEVFEKAEAFEPVGAGLGLGPNAVAALDWLGLADDVRQVGRAPGEAGIRTSAGRWLLRLDPAEVEARFGNPWLGVHRSDLHRVLLAAASAAEFRTDHEAVAITTSARDATVTFETPSGVSARTADLVVAADGVHSRMRSQLFATCPDAAYAGYFCWRGTVPTDRAREISSDDGLVETWRRGKRLGTVTLGDGRIYWVACPSAASGPGGTSSLEQVEACVAEWQ